MKFFSALSARQTAVLSVSAKAYLYRFCLSLCFLAIISYSLSLDSVRPGIFVLVLLNLLFCADVLFKNAKTDLGHGQFSISVLAAVSILAAFGYSLAQTFFVRPLAGDLPDLYVPLMLLLSAYLWNASRLARSKERTYVFIKKLNDFLPKSACRLTDTQERRLFARELVKGDMIKVRPGERIPCDGTIVKGETIIDESLITGNILPASKSAGRPVYAGTLNKGQDIEVRVETKLTQSALGGIIKALSDSEEHRCILRDPLDSYAPWVLGISVLGALACYFYFYAQGAYSRPLHNIGFFLFVLGVGCPLALLFCVSAPSYFVRWGAARKKIRLQNLGVLEQLFHSEVIFFDKTGTLTQGQLHIASVHAAEKREEQELLRCLVSAEQKVDGAFAKAVREYAVEHEIKPQALKDFEVFAGQGVRAVAGQDTILVGLPNWLSKLSVKLPYTLSQEQLMVCVVKNEHYLGYVLLEDSLRPEAAETVAQLKKLGKEVVLLSGDSEASVKAVARSCEIEKINFGVLPQTKAEIVGNYIALGKKVTMIGDGFNDIIALLRADASVVFSVGKNVYNNWVDAVLDRVDLAAVTDLLTLYYRWISCVRGNIVLSVVGNLLVLAGLIFSPIPTRELNAVLLSGMAAVVAIIIFNSMRLLHIK